MRDHGGDIDRAIARFGGTNWIDLSTGINRAPWPTRGLSDHALQALPTAAARAHLVKIAAEWFGCPPGLVLPLAGASAAIQLLPRILSKGPAAVLVPTYNEHAASLRAAGWRVDEVNSIRALYGADLAVVVNPNNPDGRCWWPAEIAELAQQVGHLIVDESFADPRPELSIANSPPQNVTVLRSFGKFWGLAGVRLGFVVGHPQITAPLTEQAGPWSVSGPALEIGAAAMADHEWATEVTIWLAEAANLLDKMMTEAGCSFVGGTHLFRLYDLPDAQAMQDRLARHAIWSRIFPWNSRWLRLGLPGNRQEFARLDAALKA